MLEWFFGLFDWVAGLFDPIKRRDRIIDDQRSQIGSLRRENEWLRSCHRKELESLSSAAKFRDFVDTLGIEYSDDVTDISMGSEDGWHDRFSCVDLTYVIDGVRKSFHVMVCQLEQKQETATDAD